MNFESSSSPERLSFLWRKLTDSAYTMLTNMKDETLRLGEYGILTFSNRNPNLNGSDKVILFRGKQPFIFDTQKFFAFPEIKQLLIKQVIMDNNSDQMLQQEIINYFESNGVGPS